jgi:ABC-type multidrug transport system fused ATPase/permease subunit
MVDNAMELLPRNFNPPNLIQLDHLLRWSVSCVSFYVYYSTYSIYLVDVRMPYYTEFVVQALFLCLSQIFVVCLVYPMFIFIAFGIVGLFIFFDVYMNRGVLEARKLENKSKSPVLTDITSIMPGISVIRGFERQSVFQDKFSVDLNRNLAAQMLFRYSNRWYGFRMDLLGTLTILCTAGVCIFSRGSVTPAEAGLALANVFQVATFIPYVMRMKADFRARFNSVERISE